MKKQFAALLAALSLLPTLALAQDYYTLPEIREQAKDGWHETYTDKYGRETVVDIDVEVYGEETAPVLKVGWGKYGKFTYDNILVLGIGGSALGGIAVTEALLKPYWNMLTPEQRDGMPRIFFLDNIDPDSITGLLEMLDLKKTLVNVITKSGSTAETMSQGTGWQEGSRN